MCFDIGGSPNTNPDPSGKLRQSLRALHLPVKQGERLKLTAIRVQDAAAGAGRGLLNLLVRVCFRQEEKRSRGGDKGKKQVTAFPSFLRTKHEN